VSLEFFFAGFNWFFVLDNSFHLFLSATTFFLNFLYNWFVEVFCFRCFHFAATIGGTGVELTAQQQQPSIKIILPT
jgi:hypothetical protein